MNVTHLTSAAFALLVIGSTACTDTLIEERYSTWEEANDNGIFQRGWLPNWLPEDIKNIYEKHDLDSNRSTTVFELDREYQDVFDEECHKATDYQPPIYLKTKFKSLYNENSEILNCGNQFAMVEQGIVIMWRP